MADKKNPYSLREIFQQMELALIVSLKRTFSRHKNEELKEGFQWEQWQLAKLRSLVGYRKANKDVIGSYSNTIENTINEVLTENFKVGERRVERDLGEIKLPSNNVDPNDRPKVPKEQNFFGVNEKKLGALQQSIRNDINNAQHSILRYMDDVYRQIIFKTQYMMQAGATTLYQAIDMAAADFLESGVNSITFKNGRRVNIASYAEMALRTASQRATFLGEGKKRDEWEINTVVVSAHATTCEKCLPWQAKILIDDVFSHGTKSDGSYPKLSEAMKAGLLHPQCRHTLITYFPDITKLPDSVDSKEALENYKKEQKQRYMERQIRKWKRVKAGYLDAENVSKANSKILEWQGKIREHLKANPQLRRQYWREQPKVAVEKNGKDDILSNKKWLESTFPTQKKFDKHVEKHLGEYGNITPEKYLNIARNLLSSPLSDDVEGFVSKIGFIFKYRKSTNDFAIGRDDGKISTLYKPKEYYEHWLQQIRDYKEE